MSRTSGLSIAVLGLFLVVAASLTASLRLVDLSQLPGEGAFGGLTPPSVQLPLPASTGAGPVSSEVTTLVLLGLLLTLTILFWRRRIKDDTLIWRSLGMILLFAVYPIAVLLFRIFPGWVGNPDQSLVLTLLVLASTGLILASSIFIGLAWYERSRDLRTSAAMQAATSVKGVRKLLESMRERLYSAKESEAYRDAVVSCYSAMTALLERQGVRDRPSFTPRELQSNAGRTLITARPEIDVLTKLFEKARYDQMPMKKEDAEQSMEALGSIIDSLSRAG